MSDYAVVVLRAYLTADEHRALRHLSVERGQTLSQLTTAALQTSPVTRKAFQTKESK